MKVDNSINKVIGGILLLVAFIHLLPVIGVTGASSLHTLYGVHLVQADMLILMSHRAVLFALLGVFFLMAVFKKRLRSTAIIAGLLSTSSFVLIGLWIGQYNEKIERVMLIDVVACVLLILAGFLHWLFKRKR